MLPFAVHSDSGITLSLVRSLVPARTYTAVAVITLGTAMGASAAIFTIVDAVVLKPLPYQDPDRIVMVFENRAQGYPEDVTKYPRLPGPSRGQR